MTLKQTDIFSIASGFDLSRNDQLVVSFLYQPLMGTTSYALYMLLWMFSCKNEIVSKKHSHSKLVNMLSISPSKLLITRNRLEAFGLITVLFNGVDYLYELKRPLSADDFVNGSELASILHDQIGENSFKELVDLLRIKKASKKGFSNITKRFDEIYDFSNIDSSAMPVFNNVASNNIATGLDILNANFDYDAFLDRISYFIKDENITKDFRETIVRLSKVYSLDENEMRTVYVDSINTKTLVIDYDVLSKNAKKKYEYKNKTKTIEIYEKKELENITANRKNKANIDKVGMINTDINYLKSVTPTKFLKDSINGNKVSSADLNIINVLLEYGFSDEVVNVMLSNVLSIQQGTIPNVNYFQKIANAWIRKGIKTAEDALLEIEESSKKIEDYKNKKATKKSYYNKSDDAPEDVSPDWLKDYENQMK